MKINGYKFNEYQLNNKQKPIYIYTIHNLFIISIEKSKFCTQKYQISFKFIISITNGLKIIKRD